MFSFAGRFILSNATFILDGTAWITGMAPQDSCGIVSTLVLAIGAFHLKQTALSLVTDPMADHGPRSVDRRRSLPPFARNPLLMQSPCRAGKTMGARLELS
ncbi:hypothetical protein CDAR_565861 [Caerostris darwini]|uniref:Uncharacterized protein n=1 Tax=Caerostris darwini TaxID=1538125 RepID=A0AAV4UZ67_9ARAC|nr:hypothetical protein CDAR_565861 [Caerostris darwini]